MIYPLVNKEFCVFEHGPVEIVDLPMKNGGSFHRFFLGLKGRVDLSLRQLAIVPVSFCAGFFCTCFLLFLKPHNTRSNINIHWLVVWNIFYFPQ